MAKCVKINDKNPRATRLIMEENYQWKLTNAVTKNAGIFQSKQAIATWTKNWVKTFSSNKKRLLGLVNFWMLPLLNAPYLLAYNNYTSLEENTRTSKSKSAYLYCSFCSSYGNSWKKYYCGITFK